MKKLSLLLLTALTVGACKKDNGNAPADPRTDLLTAKAWRLSTVAVTVYGTVLPSSSVIADCDKDNFYRFNADKSLLADAGTVKCSTSDPQTQAGTWAFNNDQTKLTIVLPGSALNGEATIQELSATALHLVSTQATAGLTYTIDATLIPN